MGGNRAILCVTGGLLALVGVGGGVAQAATYTVWSCRGPDGAPISTEAWQPIAGGVAAQDSCATGGSLSATLRQSDTQPGRVRGHRFALPPGARIAGYRVHLRAMTANAANPVYQAGLDRDPASPDEQIEAGCPTVACTFGVPDPPLAAANLIAAEGIDGPGLAVATMCKRARGCNELVGDKILAEVRLFGAEVRVGDDAPPFLEQASGMPDPGELVTSNPVVALGAGDGGGGVAALALLIDGREVARHEAGGACRQPYVNATPCPARLTATLPLDVASAGPGVHTAALRAVDAAGNVVDGTPVTFAVAAPPGPTPPAAVAVAGISVARPVQPAAAPPKQVRITATRELISLSVPGKRSSIAGVVRDGAGRPLAGVRVALRSRPFGVLRAKLRLERSLRTDARGRFAARTTGLSRLVVLDVDDPVHKAGEPVEVRLMQRLRVTTQTVARGLRNGSTLTLRASVLGAGGGAGGKAALVQAFVGGEWTTVDSLTTDDVGTALWRYRFRATTRRTVYRFRIKVERAGDVWPWPTTTSAPLTVAVSP